MRTLLVSFVFCALFATVAVTQNLETVYTWVDEDGVTHYSNNPPETVEARSLSMDEIGPLSIIGTQGPTPLNADTETAEGEGNAAQ